MTKQYEYQFHIAVFLLAWTFSIHLSTNVTQIFALLQNSSTNHNIRVSHVGHISTRSSSSIPFASTRRRVFFMSSPDKQHQDECKNNDERIRYRGRVAYDGTNFKGWQVQSKGRTIQGEIEKTLSTRFNRQMKIVGAGRTDAGVHARGQAFHFDVYPNEVVVKSNQQNRTIDLDESSKGGAEEDIFCKSLQTSLNSMLPADVRVWNISKGPQLVTVSKTLSDGTESTQSYKWHVIYTAQQKLYVYRISLGPKAITTDPIQRYTRVHVEGEVDAIHLQKVLKYYEGTHDFRAFAGAIEATQRKDGIEHKNTVRTVYSASLIDEDNGNFRIEIYLQGALYKMVRNMVGTAIDVCRGQLAEDSMLQMLHHSGGEDGENRQFVRKDNKCKPAAPEGLTLEKVFFDDDF